MIHFIAQSTGHSVRLICQCLAFPRSSHYHAATPTQSQRSDEELSSAIAANMKRKRHTPEEIIKKLREAAGLIAGGKTAEEAARLIGVSVPTYHRWKEQHGGAEKSTVKRLKELEKETSGASWPAVGCP